MPGSKPELDTQVSGQVWRREADLVEAVRCSSSGDDLGPEQDEVDYGVG